MKNNKGFSLVELIIVIAIMAVLVGVMAPQYIKYVEKSRISTDEDNASEILGTFTTALTDEDAIKDLSTGETDYYWNKACDGVGEISSSSASVYASGDPLLDQATTTLGATAVTVKSTKYKSSAYLIDIYYVSGEGYFSKGIWQQ